MNTTPFVPRLPSLRRIREARFLTQQMLADQAGVNWTTIARLESGRVEARFSTLRKLARALKVAPEELVKERLSDESS